MRLSHLVLFTIFLLAFFVYPLYAWECDYGTVKAWVKLPNETEWREAIVRGVTLKVHEPFKVKVQVATKTKCHVDIELYDPGVTKVFEVVEGPSRNGEMIYNTNVPANWSKTYEWTVRPTGEWTEGWAPWNVEVFFMRTQDDGKKIDRTIIHAYISPEEWKGESEEIKENNQSDVNSPSQNEENGRLGISILVVIIVVILLLIVLVIWKFK